MRLKFDSNKLMNAYLATGLTQKEFAEKAKIHVPTLRGALLGGAVEPLTYKKICTALGIENPMDFAEKETTMLKKVRDVFFTTTKLYGGGYSVIAGFEMTPETFSVNIEREYMAADVASWARRIYADDEKISRVDIGKLGNGYIVIAQLDSGKSYTVWTRDEEEAEEIKIFIEKVDAVESKLQPLTVAESPEELMK